MQPFLEISWRASGFRVVERSRGQALVAVRLVSRSADWPDTAFLLELHATTAGWLASNWVPAASGVPSAA